MFFALFFLSAGHEEKEAIVKNEEYFETEEFQPSGDGFAGQLAKEIDRALQESEKKHPEQFYLIKNITDTLQTAINESLLYPSMDQVKPHLQRAFDICTNILEAAGKAALKGTINVTSEVGNFIKDIGLDRVAELFQSAFDQKGDFYEIMVPEEELNKSILILKNASKSTGRLIRRLGSRISKNFKQTLFELGLRSKPVEDWTDKFEEQEENETNDENENENKTKKYYMKQEDILPEAVNAFNNLFKAAYVMIFNKTEKLIEAASKIVGSDNIIDDIKAKAVDTLETTEKNQKERDRAKGYIYKPEKIDLEQSIDAIKVEALRAKKALEVTLTKHAKGVGEYLKGIINEAIDGADDFEENDESGNENKDSAKNNKQNESKEEEKNEDDDDFDAYEAYDHETLKENLKKERKKFKESFKNSKKRLSRLFKKSIKAVKDEASRFTPEEFARAYKKIAKEEEEKKREQITEEDDDVDYEKEFERNNQNDVSDSHEESREKPKSNKNDEERMNEEERKN